MTSPLCSICESSHAHMQGSGFCHKCWALMETVKSSEDLVRKILAILKKERSNS